MLDNTFKADAINDIDCSITDSGATSSGNTALGGLQCSTRGNCPLAAGTCQDL
jgi:ABC-type taurine transport system substrate-binding protein